METYSVATRKTLRTKKVKSEKKKKKKTRLIIVSNCVVCDQKSQISLKTKYCIK